MRMNWQPGYIFFSLPLTNYWLPATLKNNTHNTFRIYININGIYIPIVQVIFSWLLSFIKKSIPLHRLLLPFNLIPSPVGVNLGLPTVLNKINRTGTAFSVNKLNIYSLFL